MKKLFIPNLIAIGITAVSLMTAYAGWKPSDTEIAKKQDITNSEVAEAIASLKNNYPHLNSYFEKAYGYAVFPTVTKGAIGIGAAHGNGEVYEKGKLIGTATLTQVTIGAQLGGQVYTEVIFFKDKETLNDFMFNNVKLGAQASAVAANSGVSSDADYNNGVAVFTLAKNGLMYEASVGGQKFRFKPIEPK